MQVALRDGSKGAFAQCIEAPASMQVALRDGSRGAFAQCIGARRAVHGAICVMLCGMIFGY
jgi:hypothetical protein